MKRDEYKFLPCCIDGCGKQTPFIPVLCCPRIGFDACKETQSPRSIYYVNNPICVSCFEKKKAQEYLTEDAKEWLADPSMGEGAPDYARAYVLLCNMISVSYKEQMASDNSRKIAFPSGAA